MIDLIKEFPYYYWVLLVSLLAIVLWHLARLLLVLQALAVTPRASRWLSRLVGRKEHDENTFFSADGAPENWVAKRRRAFAGLQHSLMDSSAAYASTLHALRDSVSDLRFFDANRVPFPFAAFLRERVNLAVVAKSSRGCRIIDADGREYLDISGSYGVNVAGYERYKTWLDEGLKDVQALGPVLGPMHPLVLDNAQRLKAISGQEEISFHVSGTEAVMAAVRLARFNTGREKIVTFSGSYHGWWDGVQPGLGSERAITDCMTLKEMSRASLRAIRVRRRDIAAVIVNPVQSFNPNTPPPNDAVLMSSEIRKTEQSTDAYGEWLRALRDVCSDCNVPLIFDEVYSGFRLAVGGAQAYYGVKADMVIYGKTLAAGLPIGVVCGRARLMRRFDPDHPMRIAYVVGTFSGYPAAMGPMNRFLRWLDTEEASALYQATAVRTASWSRQVNDDMQRANLPLSVACLGTIFTFEFSQPSRYNWMLQYYLRNAGINLSWVGTGRCLISLDFNDGDFIELRAKVREAAMAMRRDGWWLSEADHPGRDAHIRRQLARDMMGSIVSVPKPVQAFYSEVMRRKHDDHVASHSDRTNQFLHLISSSVFIFCYVLIFFDLELAMWLGLGALILRQAGHALIEPPCHDKEQLLLGFDTRSKTVVVLMYFLIPLVHAFRVPEFTTAAVETLTATVAQQWFVFTLLVIGFHVLRLIFRHGAWNAMVWFVKLITDPFTDVRAYYASALPARS